MHPVNSLCSFSGQQPFAAGSLVIATTRQDRTTDHQGAARLRQFRQGLLPLLAPFNTDTNTDIRAATDTDTDSDTDTVSDGFNKHRC